jgi:regulator of protease activity HflC (stomatin/prohibitin superfamily)
MISPISVALALLVVIFISGLRIAREYERAVVFRLGRYTGLRGPGLFCCFLLELKTKFASTCVS